METDWRNKSGLYVRTRGRTVTAEEWYGWRARGMSAGETAGMLGISPSMAGFIGRRFREAGVPDPQYRKRRPGAPRDLGAWTDAGRTSWAFSGGELLLVRTGPSGCGTEINGIPKR